MAEEKPDWYRQECDKLNKAIERMNELDEALKSRDPRRIREALERYEKEIGNGEE